VGGKPRLLLLRQPTQVRRPVQREQDVTARLAHAAQLVQPGLLQWLVQVREHRQRVNEVERLRRIGQRRCKLVQLETGGSEVLPAPRDRQRVIVGAVHLHLAAPHEVAQDASAAAAEIQHVLQSGNVDAVPRERLLDRRGAGPPQF